MLFLVFQTQKGTDFKVNHHLYFVCGLRFLDRIWFDILMFWSFVANKLNIQTRILDLEIVKSEKLHSLWDLLSYLFLKSDKTSWLLLRTYSSAYSSSLERGQSIYSVWNLNLPIMCMIYSNCQFLICCTKIIKFWLVFIEQTLYGKNFNLYCVRNTLSHHCQITFFSGNWVHFSYSN